MDLKWTKNTIGIMFNNFHNPDFILQYDKFTI